MTNDLLIILSLVAVIVLGIFIIAKASYLDYKSRASISSNAVWLPVKYDFRIDWFCSYGDAASPVKDATDSISESTLKTPDISSGSSLIKEENV